MPSWRRCSSAIANAWTTQREEIIDGSRADHRRGCRRRPRSRRPPRELDAAALDGAITTLKRSYDAEYGGWGGAPKFPSASAIEFLLRRGERQMALHTLRRMAGGGIYDQIGGGFARYSVDARWIVPHFEKMLYDNALLVRAYLHAFQVSGEPLFDASAARRSTGRCASCSSPRAALRARSTPTRRASRASSTCGGSTRSAPRSTPSSPTPRSRTSA